MNITNSYIEFVTVPIYKLDISHLGGFIMYFPYVKPKLLKEHNY